MWTVARAGRASLRASSLPFLSSLSPLFFFHEQEAGLLCGWSHRAPFPSRLVLPSLLFLSAPLAFPSSFCGSGAGPSPSPVLVPVLGCINSFQLHFTPLQSASIQPCLELLKIWLGGLGWSRVAHVGAAFGAACSLQFILFGAFFSGFRGIFPGASGVRWRHSCSHSFPPALPRY